MPEDYPERKDSQTNKEITIRTATVRDAQRLCEIYAPYVEKTAVTFEYRVPTAAEFADRICQVLTKYPYLVAEKDGRIIGYAYANPFVNRAAYDWCAEVVIYLDQDRRRQGFGRQLYEALEQALSAQNVTNLYACIATPPSDEDRYLSHDSVRFHEHMGYQLAGEFKECGYKFHHWYNMVWMEKMIGVHTQAQPPFRIYRAVEDTIP